jgi:putative ABC transport system substrate-binding protein
VNRREFITLLSSAAAAPSLWPLVARAQQPLPVIGYLYPTTPETSEYVLTAFRKGLAEAGYVEGRNVTIEYRFAHDQLDRLGELAADLVHRRVAVIATPGGTAAALAAKAATATIPIVFQFPGDPVQVGLVASLNRPGGNITGINSMNVELLPKRLSLLRELVPTVQRLGALINPAAFADTQTAVLQTAAAELGLPIDILSPRTSREIDAAFETLVQKRADALLVSTAPLFIERRVQLITLSARLAMPTIYGARELAEAGGLMSYGTSLADQYRQVGVYVGRILKGEKPADLPVIRAAKFEFIINLQTARTLRIEVPQTLLASADEVIE